MNVFGHSQTHTSSLISIMSAHQRVYQIWSLYHYPLQRYEVRYKIVKMGWFWVAMGHSRSLEVVPFD